MASVKDRQTMVSYFTKAFEAKHGRKPNINRYSAQWGFDAMLQDMSMAQSKELIDFYLTTPADRDHNLDWFFYNYDKLNKSRYEAEQDKAAMQKLMAESKQRAQEWRASGKRGITSD